MIVRKNEHSQVLPKTEKSNTKSSAKMEKKSKFKNDSNRKNEPLKDFIDRITDSKGNENYNPPIDKIKLEMIRDDLTNHYAGEVLQALNDESVKEKLVEVVKKRHGNLFTNDKQKIAEYAVRETVGTGIIEQILTNPNITDLAWNATHLAIETDDEELLVEGSKLGITENYIDRIIQKYSALNDKAFSSGNPILDGMFRGIRINAVHKDNSPDGATMSLRVTRPKLALNNSNFANFAPNYILELFEKIVKTRANIVISGETGTGKTELQKLLLSFVKEGRIIMIEDVRETHIKQLFPEKDIMSWEVTKKTPITELVKACLRNFPKWIVVSETRGEEAYEMLEAVLTGHNIITTVHAVNARAIIRRFVSMCSKANVQSLVNVEEDLKSYLDFGVHIKVAKIDGKKFRYLSEIVEFTENGTVTVFKQKLLHGKLIQEHGELSDEFKERMAENYLDFEFPKEVISA